MWQYTVQQYNVVQCIVAVASWLSARRGNLAMCAARTFYAPETTKGQKIINSCRKNPLGPDSTVKDGSKNTTALQTNELWRQCKLVQCKLQCGAHGRTSGALSQGLARKNHIWQSNDFSDDLWFRKIIRVHYSSTKCKVQSAK